MTKLRRSSVYLKWLNKLKDPQARARIITRVKRLGEGNPGDVEPAGEGISEMRIDYGPGYRVYYKDTGKEIIILLCGGDKKPSRRILPRQNELPDFMRKEKEYGNRDKGKSYF